jgi:hypothetical protein
MKSIIEFFKKLFFKEKPKSTVKINPPKVVNTKPVDTEDVLTYDYKSVHCDTGYEQTVKSYSKLKKGTTFFMSNRDYTGCYTITGTSKTPGKRTLRKNIKTFTSCEECTK